MHKFFVANDKILDEIAYIDGEDVKHIIKVLRLNIGDKVFINNCVGDEYIGEIVDITKLKVSVKLLEKKDIELESKVKISLFQGLPKASKMDYIIQKSTEIGIVGIYPVLTKRVIVRNELGEFKKKDRWKKIAIESSKQCHRGMIPSISDPIDFESMINIVKTFDLSIVPYENQKGYGIKKLMKEINREKVNSIAIIVGPEGGFEEDEISRLKSEGAFIVTLGPRIFRTETAGIIGGTILQYELGDLGGAL